MINGCQSSMAYDNGYTFGCWHGHTDEDLIGYGLLLWAVASLVAVGVMMGARVWRWEPQFCVPTFLWPLCLGLGVPAGVLYGVAYGVGALVRSYVRLTRPHAEPIPRAKVVERGGEP